MNRNANGTFGKGNKFSKGRIKGSRNRATLLMRHVCDSDPRLPDILRDALLELGRRRAAEIESGVLPQAEEPRPDLDIETRQTIDAIIEAQSEIVLAVVSRRITPYGGKKVLKVLNRHRAVLERPPRSGA